MVGKDLQKHFAGRPSIITAGNQLYEALGEEDGGYAGDIRAAKEWARTPGVTDWFTWGDFEDMPES